MGPKRRKSNNSLNSFLLIIDVGIPTSRLLANNRTFAEQAKECAITFLEQKIFAGSNDDFSLIILGSEVSDNLLDYKHVRVLRNFGPVNWEVASLIENEVRVSSFEGDWMDALGVALDMLHKRKEDGHVYEKSQILIFSPFDSPCKTSEKTESAYVRAIQAEQSDLFFIGSDIRYDDESNLLNDKASLNKGELTACKLVEETNGAFISFDEFSASVLSFITQPRMGTAWNCTLDIGSQIKIHVSGYIKAKKGDTITWKEETADEEAMVARERTYEKDPTSLVDKNYIIQAYKYGSKNIPVPKETEDTFCYKSGDKSFTLLAFVDPFPPQFYIGSSTMYFFAQRKAGIVDRAAQIALSALIYAMEETGKVALVRRVYQTNSRVTIGVLTPRIKFQYECLVYHELPFSDDWRQYEFPPVITPKNQPSQEQFDAIDQLIEKFNLINPDKKEEFSFNSKEMTDPHEEYVRTVIAFKALHPDLPIPDIPQHIRMHIAPPPSVLVAAKDALERIKELFPLEVIDRNKVHSSEAFKRGALSTASAEEDVKNLAKKPRLDEAGEVDLMSIFGTEVTKMGTTAPVQDFLELLKSKKKSVDEVFAEMEKITVDLLSDSGGTNAAILKKTEDCIKIYRQYAKEEGHAEAFNRWMRRFKEYAVSHYFQDFWQRYVVEKNLGLISKSESPVSDVSEEETKQFLILSEPKEAENQLEDDDALLDLI